MSSTTQDGLTVSYEFNDANQLTKLTQPSEINGTGTEETEYLYNDLGQMWRIEQNDKVVKDFHYNDIGQVYLTKDYLKFEELDYTVKQFTNYGYNYMGQLTEIKYWKFDDQGSIVDLEKYQYDYDLRGNIETETMSTYYDCEDGTASQTREYDYDSLNRIETMDIAGYETEYEYDNAGNKTKETVQIGNSEFRIYTNTYNEFDQLTQVDLASSNGTQTIGEYYYDDRGAQIHSVSKDYNRVIGQEPIYQIQRIYLTDPETGFPIYDEHGQPAYIEVEVIVGYDDIWLYPGGAPSMDTYYTYDKGGYMSMTETETNEKDLNGNRMFTTATHFYNGMEQRVSKTTDQIETKYFYSGTSLLFTADENNAKMSENIITLGGQTIASKSYTGNYADEFYFYNQDIRNSTTAIIGLDSSDNFELMKGYTYDIYGKATAIGNEDFINDITFTGAIAEGGDIYYMHARFYDANTQRFLSQDTYKGNAYDPWTQNLYSYCGNNPTNMVDPTGHFGIPSSNLFRIIRDFFDSNTGKSSSSSSSKNGYFFAEGTETTGFSEWNFRFNGTDKYGGGKGMAAIGIFGKAGIQQLNGFAGIDFNGKRGEGDIILGVNGVLDLIVAKGKAGIGCSKDFLGLILEAKAAVASGRGTVELDLYGWEIEAGITLELLSYGIKYQNGYFLENDKVEYISEGNVGAGLVGGGYIVRVKPPQ